MLTKLSEVQRDIMIPMYWRRMYYWDDDNPLNWNDVNWHQVHSTGAITIPEDSKVVSYAETVAVSTNAAWALLRWHWGIKMDAAWHANMQFKYYHHYLNPIGGNCQVVLVTCLEWDVPAGVHTWTLHTAEDQRGVEARALWRTNFKLDICRA